jgi:hypothetical protein
MDFSYSSFNKRKFLFRCLDCQMIIAIDFEDEKEIEDILNGELKFECLCQGMNELLLD